MANASQNGGIWFKFVSFIHSFIYLFNYLFIYISSAVHAFSMINTIIISTKYGETGRLPLASHYHVRCFKYWLKLLSMPDHRYPKRCYLLLKQHDMNGRKNWVSQIREMLLKFDSMDF